MSKEQQDHVPPERWSARAKTEVILRLFRGESVDTVSRETQVPAHEIETWRLSYVGEPECNGIMERWIRTLKEECLYLHDFHMLEDARAVIGDFIARYNREWLIERHGHRTPTAVRHALTRKAA